jgi:alpha-glucosidase (family GH31 glycosyl hydrolase)
MNKLGFFTVTLICLLFVNFASSVRTSDKLSARLAIRRNQLKVEVPAAGANTPSTGDDIFGLGDSEKNLDPAVEDLQTKVSSAVSSLHAAEENLNKVMSEAKERKKQAALKKVKDSIEAQINKLEKVKKDKEQASRASKATRRVLADPSTFQEIQDALQKRIQSEIVRTLHEESVRKQISKELEDQLVLDAEKAHNATVGARLEAAKSIAEALTIASSSFDKAGSQEEKVANDLKKSVESAISNARVKFDKLVGDQTPPAATTSTSASTPAATPSVTPAVKAGLVQMENSKKLKQQLKRS